MPGPMNQPEIPVTSDIEASIQREGSLRELLDWANGFIERSRTWRRNSWETRWHQYQRDADGIYDPELAALKKPWQSKAFIPLIPSHRESIQAQMYKTIMGARPPLEMKARGKFAQPGEDQSDNIRDLILREIEKSRLEIGFNNVLDDATTYGSGFCRIRFEEKYGDRKVRLPLMQEADPVAIAMAAQSGQLPTGPGIEGYGEQISEVLTYRGIRFDWVSIWDVYPDPRSLQVKGSTIFVKYPITYGEVVKGVEKGYFFPEALERLKHLDDQNDSKNVGKKTVRDNRQITDVEIPTPDYGRELECYEGFALLPKKWAYLKGEQIDDPEKLVPCRVIVHPNCILAIEPNDQYEGNAPIFKLDYLPVNGQFYGRGIPEMLGALQDVINEGVNARIDAIAIKLNHSFAVIEQFLINPKEIGQEPGIVARIDAKAMRSAGFDDIRKAMMELPLGNIDRAAFIDTQEMERYAQERTSASKVTLGTANGRDTNDTLGGMELLKQVTNEKIAYIGMLAEFMFLHEIFREYWKVIYSNIQPEDVVNVLGDRAMTFQLLTPEQIEMDYKYEPQGIFTQENKAQVQARLAAVHGQFAAFPWIKHEAFFDKELQSINEDPESYRMSPEELQGVLVAQGMMQGQGDPQQEQGPNAKGPAKPSEGA